MNCEPRNWGETMTTIRGRVMMSMAVTIVTAPSPTPPAQLCLPIQPGTRPAFYVGRDKDAYFKGAIDSVRRGR